MGRSVSDPVFLVDVVPPVGPYTLDGEEGRHAATVKRLRPGEPLVLADGAGTWAPSTVVENNGKSLTVEVGPAKVDGPPAVEIVLVQALPKGERSDLAVELATEAGVDAIVPWQAARCVARWDGAPDKAERGRAKWAKVAAQAAKQSRRRRIPQVHPLARTAAVVEAIRAADAAVVLHEVGAVSLASVEFPTRGRLLLIVGPEGGIAPEEIAEFAEAGAQTVRLGPEVLRTSTAAAVALGALGVLTGRWGPAPTDGG